MKRTLTLRRETLTELGADALAAIAGGTGGTGPQPTPPIYAPRTIPLEECLVTMAPRCH